MSSRRRRDRPRRTAAEREPQGQSVIELQELAAALPSAPDVAVGTGRVLSVVADPFRVVSVDRTQCQVAGCPARAIPELWEVVDLDTGQELPLRLCEEHQLAYLRS